MNQIWIKLISWDAVYKFIIFWWFKMNTRHGSMASVCRPGQMGGGLNYIKYYTEKTRDRVVLGSPALTSLSWVANPSSVFFPAHKIIMLYLQILAQLCWIISASSDDAAVCANLNVGHFTVELSLVTLVLTFTRGNHYSSFVWGKMYRDHFTECSI